MSSIVKGGVHYIGVTTTDLTDGSAATSVTINGVSTLVKSGDIVIRSKSAHTPAYSTDVEFIYDGSHWNEFGIADALKAMAYADTASGSTSYTPAGSLTGLGFSGSVLTSTGSYTPAGTVSLSSDNTASFYAFNGSSYTPTGSVSAAFSGNALTVTGSYKPAGSVALTGTSAVTAEVLTASSGTNSYTPAGSVSAAFSGNELTSTGSYTPEGVVPAQTISLKTDGGKATIHNPSSKNVVVSATQGSLPSYTAPTFTPASYTGPTFTPASCTFPTLTASVTGETLEYTLTEASFSGGSMVSGTFSGGSLTGGSFDAGSLPTFTTGNSITTTDVTALTSAPAYSAASCLLDGTAKDVTVTGTPSGSITGAKFTGTAVHLKTATINIHNGATFTGTDATISASGTPSGSITGAKFTGDAYAAKSVSFGIPTGATFTGTSATISVTGTPAGSVSGGFSGTPATISVTVSPDAN